MRLLRKGDVFTLTEGERWVAEAFGYAREQANLEVGIVREAVEKMVRDGVTQNVMGMGGEVVTARVSNTNVDLTLGPRRGTPDHLLHSGHTADTKTIPVKYRDHPELQVSTKKRRIDADLYLLYLCDFPTYTFVGWETNDVVFAAEVRDSGHGPDYVIQGKNLRPVLDLDDPFRVIDEAEVAVAATGKDAEFWRWFEED